MAAGTTFPSSRIESAATAGLVTAYFLLALWGTEGLGGRTAPTSLIWPASGVGLALVLLRGTGVWPLIFAAAVASSLLAVDADSLFALLAEALFSGITSVLEPLFAAWLIWRVAGEAFAERASAFVFSMLAAVPVAACVAAAPLVVTEVSTGILTARSELGLVAAWYSASVSNLMGMLVLTPPIWIWARQRAVQVSPRRGGEVLVFAGAALVVFALPEAAQPRYLLVALHLAVALRLPLKWSAAGVALTSLAYLGLASIELRDVTLPDLYTLFLNNVAFVTILNLATYVTALLQLENEGRARRLGELADHLGEAEERERKRIAQVLHDELQQLLVAAKLRLGQCSGEATEHVRSRIDDAITVSRTLTVELHPPALEDLPFGSALEGLARRTQELTGLEVRVEADEHVEPGSSGMRTFLYQAVRELLMNVVKHAETDRAWVRLRQSGDWLQVEVEDSGKGCDPDRFDWAPREGSKYGAATLKQRVELFDGRFEMFCEQGCRITLTVPVLR